MNSLKLANFFSEVGTAQFLLSIYKEEIVIYAQVSENTSNKLNKKFNEIKELKLLEGKTISLNGLTYCWIYQYNSHFLPIMNKITKITEKVIPDLIINYKKDSYLNTLESFLQLIP